MYLNHMYIIAMCKFPMAPHVRLLVGWLVDQSVMIPLYGGKLHFQAPIRALVYIHMFMLEKSSMKKLKHTQKEEYN